MKNGLRINNRCPQITAKKRKGATEYEIHEKQENQKVAYLL